MFNRADGEHFPTTIFDFTHLLFPARRDVACRVSTTHHQVKSLLQYILLYVGLPIV